MENDPSPTHMNRPRFPAWIIAIIILLCAALVLVVVLVAAGLLFFVPISSKQVSATQPLAMPARETRAVATAATSQAGEPPTEASALVLDYEAEPTLGSINLQRAFTPDPYHIELSAGGTADTSEMGLHCGFTSPNPAFSFVLRGGASETFLRIYFVPGDNTDTTLVIHTPDGQWLCNDNYISSSGIDPVIEFEFGPSGEYAIWVGTHESGSLSTGNLYITESQENAP